MIRDLEVLKQGNCNHVRTCHYSDDPRWYELCDEWGIWLVAEANCECHGYDGRFDDEPRMRDAIIDRSVANVENHKNHPSVIIWSLGNECGGRGKNFIDAMHTIKAIDPTRPVHYERFGMGEGNPSDFDQKMYGTPTEFERIAKDKKPHQAVLYLRVRPRHVQLHGLGGRIQRRLRPLPRDRSAGRSGNGRTRASGTAAIRSIRSSPMAAASAKSPTIITSSTKASSPPTARPSRITPR